MSSSKITIFLSIAFISASRTELSVTKTEKFSEDKLGASVIN